MNTRKEATSTKPLSRPYFKLVDLKEEFYNPILRTVLAGRRGHLPSVEQDGFVYVEASNENLVGLNEQGISCLSGRGYIEDNKFAFDLAESRTIKQYLLPENEPSISLISSASNIRYKAVEAARDAGNLKFFEPFYESIREYFAKAGKKVYVELNNLRVITDPKLRGPVVFNLYEHAPGNMPLILPITKTIGAAKLFLRQGENGFATFWFEPAYPIVIVSFKESE